MTLFLHDKSRFVHTAFLPANLVNTFGNCYEYLRKRLLMCTSNRLTFDRPETQFFPLSFRFHEIALCKRTALSQRCVHLTFIGARAKRLCTDRSGLGYASRRVDQETELLSPPPWAHPIHTKAIGRGSIMHRFM
jgi:hypothetical protein